MRIIAAVGLAVVIGVASLTPASAQKETANRPDQADTWTIDAWTIDESRSPIDDSPQVTATLNAVGYDARMSLRCEDKKTEANFFLPSKLLGSREYVKVLLRLPSGVETMLSPSTNDQSFYAGSAEQFIRQLPDSGTIIIRASGDAGRAAGGEFKLGNFSAIRQKIAQACNWSSERAQNSSARPIATPVNVQISAELAKKCRALMIKAHPTEVYGPTGSAAPQRAYFKECISQQGNMSDTSKASGHPQPSTTGSGN
jgi:hypothetical protein